ncbi:hypothetical protein SNE40_022664 [Patella caerulea]|uniref:TGF-beta propeptide domain-containing protein n=1 Tax=Patella caerulea TaxID=87958 RepID=A0AAN8IW22_PATCE
MVKKIWGVELILLACVHHFSIAQISSQPQEDIEEFSNSTNSLPTEESAEHNIRMRQRYREYRLNMIRQQILNTLGWSKPPTIDFETRENLFSNPSVTPQGRFIHENQCFASRCDVPDSINYSLWTENSNVLHLYQDVPELNNRKQLTSATLRLYIRYNAGNTHGRGSSRLLISVSQFLRPLHIRRRGGRVINRKRLIDAKMVNWEGASWVVLNVKDAVSEWITGSRENYGLAVAVKDENENEVNASMLFEQIDCYSPSNIGCREEEDINERGTIWTVGSYPYLQIATKERVRHRHRRQVVNTFTKTTDNTQLNYRNTQRTFPQIIDENKYQRHRLRDSGCAGKLIVKQIKDSNIITPRTYTTLQCSGTCPGGKKCQASRFEKVKGFVFTSDRTLSYQDTSIVRTVECSCHS